eukprot:4652-Heterococcus_DN1.PRE.2
MNAEYCMRRLLHSIADIMLQPTSPQHAVVSTVGLVPIASNRVHANHLLAVRDTVVLSVLSLIASMKVSRARA